MSLDSYVNAIPKVELFLQLEGALQRDRLLTIADQNEVFDDPDSLAAWLETLTEPDAERRYELMAETSRWLQYDDDVAHVVYETGLALARQNVVYAEIHVNPAHFTEHRWSFEKLLAALNDGRRRAEVAWQIQLRWVLSVFRDQPRHADEVVRLASSEEGMRGGIVGICLAGPEDAQPPGQFERAFRTAARKGVPTAVHANANANTADNLREMLETLQPQRLIGGLGVADDPALAAELEGQGTSLVVTMGEAVALGLIDDYEAYPLKRLEDEGLNPIAASAMPSYYASSLTDEHLAVVNCCGLGADELQTMVLNSVHTCWLPDEEKAALELQVSEQLTRLTSEHLAASD